MAITADTGPLIIFGQSVISADNNPDLGPSMFYAGAGFLDPRPAFTYIPGEAQGAPDFGWLGFDNITTLNQAPYTLAAAAVVASANPTGAALVLVSANSATTGVAIVPSIVRSDTGALDTGVGGLGLVALDAFGSVTASITNGVMTVTANTAQPITVGATVLTTGTVTAGALGTTQVTGFLTGIGGAGTYVVTNAGLTTNSGTVTLAVLGINGAVVPFGQPQSIGMWNPQALVARALSVTAAAGATYTTATIAGYDIYGFPMVEAITLTAGSAVSGKKAFKYVRSVTLSGGSADTTHAYSVGTTDIYGLPLRADTFGGLAINYAASLTASTVITAATGFVGADLTVATATTGDVRGTYALQTAAATGVNRLTVRQTPQPYAVGAIAGLYGTTQFANF